MDEKFSNENEILKKRIKKLKCCKRKSQ
jgi:hypothetical protein